MSSLFPPRESLVVTSRLGTGNSRTFFYAGTPKSREYKIPDGSSRDTLFRDTFNMPPSPSPQEAAFMSGPDKSLFLLVVDSATLLLKVNFPAFSFR